MNIEQTMRSLEGGSRARLVELLNKEQESALSRLAEIGLSVDDTNALRGRIQFIKMLLNGANSAAQAGR